MTKPYDRGLVWFRRDLRAADHAALHHALKACRQVFCFFVLDREILEVLPRVDRRVEFILDSLHELDSALRQLAVQHGVAGAGLLVQHDRAIDAVPQQAQALKVQAVFYNHDYEPQAIARDAAVAKGLAVAGIAFHSFKDHVIFERGEVQTQTGKPYSVFTPYKKAWLNKIDSFYLRPYAVAPHAAALAPKPAAAGAAIPPLADLGFDRSNLQQLQLPAGSSGSQRLLNDFLKRIDRYHATRDFPAIRGPSYLSVHLRFGTVSIRELAAVAFELQKTGSPGAAVWLSELIWRDFYAQILSNFPHVAERAFKPAYDAIAWESGPHADALFNSWCEGQTGYPLVDAAMAQINQTGYMHNRLRMVTACFLIKDLGIDWRRGERYFAQKLNDFDLSANNGGWQWAASSGCDAQPYFRIFNPVSQSTKFDGDGKFIRKYLPVLARLDNNALHSPWLAPPAALAAAGVSLGENYPRPLVEHAEARVRTLQRYAVVKKA